MSRFSPLRRDIVVRDACVEDILDLRHAVLRAGLPWESARFNGDEAPTTRHVAAVADNRIIGCASMMLSEWDKRPAWQLRGMAVDPAWRGKGIGEMLLRAIEERARQSDVRQMWCNARTPAIRFYGKLGWQVVSDEFEIPSAGPHVRMVKRLEG